MSDEKRDFFRVEGQVYLEATPWQETNATDPWPHELSWLEIAMGHFRERINYETPALQPYFEDLLAILQKSHAKKSDSKIRKHDVIISGSGIQFVTTKSYSESAAVKLKLGFPVYPFTSVSLKASVIKCDRIAVGKYVLSCSFEDLDESTQNTIIKFVNELQRQVRVQQKMSNP